MAFTSDNTRGALFIMASMAGYTCSDAAMKVMSEDLPLFQVLFLRGVVTSCVVFVLALPYIRRGQLIDRADRPWLSWRVLAEVAAAFFFLTALFNMPLANATALIQTIPLTVTLGGAIFFGELLGWRRLTAIAIGFLGMLMIVRPGAADFNAYSIYVLIAVLCATSRDLLTRKTSARTPSILITLLTSVSVAAAAGLASLTIDWAPLDLRLAGLIILSGTLIVGAYHFGVLAMRAGEIGFIAPYRYTSLIWALILGLLVFGDWPDALTLLGAGLIVLAGVFTLSRTRQRGKTEAVDNPTDST